MYLSLSAAQFSHYESSVADTFGRGQLDGNMKRNGSIERDMHGNIDKSTRDARVPRIGNRLQSYTACLTSQSHFCIFNQVSGSNDATDEEGVKNERRVSLTQYSESADS